MVIGMITQINNYNQEKRISSLAFDALFDDGSLLFLVDEWYSSSGSCGSNATDVVLEREREIREISVREKQKK